MKRSARRLLAFVTPLILLLFGAMTVSSEGGKATSVEGVVERAIERGLIAGAVVCAGNRNGVFLSRAYGVSAATEGAALLGERSVFDIASLTKVVATAPVVMALAERGSLSLDDPLSKWFAPFGEGQKGAIRLSHLLTHTSGLRDVELADRGPAMEEVLKRVGAQKLRSEPGTVFHYADVNFILLGEVVRRATGRSLDVWARDLVFVPLGMSDSAYLPPPDVLERCVPTSDGRGGLFVGHVQDVTARQLGGVAGHAGVFSTGGDLSRYCRMMLNRGQLDGHRILKVESILEMLSRRSFAGGAVVRGLGWDFLSPYSSPRGSRMTQESFGHTGYSGSSLWIDPVQDLFVVVLAARLDYKRTREFNQFRAEVSDAVADRWAVR